MSSYVTTTIHEFLKQLKQNKTNFMKMIEVIKENMNNSLNVIKKRKIKMAKKSISKRSQERQIIEVKE